MAKTIKWKEEREVVTCISMSPSNTTCTHSLSFTLMAKTRTRRRRKLKQLQLLTKQQNTTFFSGYLLSLDPRGVFIGTREKGARGWPVARSAGARTPKAPRKRGLGRVSTALPRRRVAQFVPCQVGLLVCWYDALDWQNRLPKVNGYLVGL